MALVRKSLLKTMLSDDSGRDRQLKYILDRINLVDKHIPDMKIRLSDYSKRIADGRKNIEKISRVFSSFAFNEPLEMTLKIGLKNFASILQDVLTTQDDFNGELSSILDELDVLSRRCKHLRDDVKSAETAADREETRERLAKRLDASNSDVSKQSSAQAELIKARSDHSRAKATLEEHADIFEQEKTQTIRDALLLWSTAELRYHAKALEIYTKAFRAAQMIDIQQDLSEYRSHAKTGNSSVSARLLTVRDTSCPYESENYNFVTSTPRVKNFL